MTNLQKFYEKLNNYETNSGTLELRTIIEKVLYTEPTSILYKGEYWEVYEIKDKNSGIEYTLKQNHNKNHFEIIEKNSYYCFKETKRSSYEIGLFSDLYVKSETIKNKLIKQNVGSQLLLDATKTVERFTKTGFQKSKIEEKAISEHFIYVEDKLTEKYDIFIPANFTHNPNECYLNNINFQPIKREYWLSSLNHTILASPEETHNLVVFYKDGTNNLCFPAFFNDAKEIYLDEFITDVRLQFYATDSSGFNEEDIVFEGHTIKDAEKFYYSRINYTECLKEYDRFNTLNKKLKK